MGEGPLGGGTSASREGRGALVYFGSLVKEMAGGWCQTKGFLTIMNKMTTYATTTFLCPRQRKVVYICEQEESRDFNTQTCTIYPLFSFFFRLFPFGCASKAKSTLVTSYSSLKSFSVSASTVLTRNKKRLGESGGAAH